MIITPRDRALSRLRGSLASGRALLATGAGSGLAAASAEQGGADLIVIYNSGRFRSAGHGSLSGLLPFGNANTIVRDLAREVLAAVRAVPVIAGVCGTDPFCNLDQFVHDLKDLGISGIQNFPTISLFPESFREELEATGISFEREVELIRAARRAGLLTCPFAVTDDDARRMAMAGADVVAVHLGVTRAARHQTALAEAALSVHAVAGAARSVRDGLLVLFHGGPAVTPADVQVILKQVDGLDGFFGASSIERIPVQAAISSTAREFTQLVRPGSTVSAGRQAPDFSQPPPPLPIELTPRTLPAYLKDHGLVSQSEDVAVEEVGGGLSNVVLRWQAADRAGVVKQARPRLRVADEWLSDVRRIINERDAIDVLRSRLPFGSVPVITFSDDETLVFGMEPAPADARLWKPELLAGRLDPPRAQQAGQLLRAIHDSTRHDPELAARFTARPLLDQNRLDPWYRTAAAAHPDLKDVFEYAIERLLTVTEVLVHGDYVPKNMFLVEHHLLLLDYEVAHFGNPGYDLATFINHMLLKGFRSPEHRTGFASMAQTMWDSYTGGLHQQDRELAEQEALLQLGALMLARIDGKSKVEYLAGTPQADTARDFGRWLMRHQPTTLREVLNEYGSTLLTGEGA